MQAFSISSGVDKAYLVDVCIKLGEALATCAHGSRSGELQINFKKENGQNALYDLVSDWTGMRH